MKIFGVLLWGIIFTCLSGCDLQALRVAQVAPAGADDAGRIIFVDHRTSPKESSFMTGGGNVYSCHYGIMKIHEDKIAPPQMDLLHNYLANRILNDGNQHNVEVLRFDIYWNRQAFLETMSPGASFLGPTGGGAVGVATTSTLQALNSPTGSVIGCKNEAVGEYYLSESPSPYSAPIVTYIDLLIDGHKYSVRDIYPIVINSDPKTVPNDSWPISAGAAVNQTFGALEQQVKQSGGNKDGTPN